MRAFEVRTCWWLISVWSCNLSISRVCMFSCLFEWFVSQSQFSRYFQLSIMSDIFASNSFWATYKGDGQRWWSALLTSEAVRAIWNYNSLSILYVSKYKELDSNVQCPSTWCLTQFSGLWHITRDDYKTQEITEKSVSNMFAHFLYLFWKHLPFYTLTILKWPELKADCINFLCYFKCNIYLKEFSGQV